MFDALVWIIELSYSLLLSYTISIHLRQNLVQVSPGLANSGAGINNWFFFVIIEQLITSKIGGETYIGVTCDEMSDISRHEQISLVISYIDREGQKRESFLGFIKTDKTDGETLFNLIKESICNFGLDMMSIVGLGFDGASNMNGPNKGVAAWFKGEVHCKTIF